MALSDKSFVDKINCCLTGSLTNIQNAQLADSIPKISTNKIDSVATFAALPVALENTGRLIFVVAEDVYYFSDGASWTKDLTSNLAVSSFYSWGCGSNGRLGDNTFLDKCSPVSVVGGITDWIQLSVGNQHNIGLRSNRTIWTWGNNTCGRLGDGTVVTKSSPVSVIGGFTDWCQVSAGLAHTAAVRTNGTLWAWGRNRLSDGAAGQLGDGTTANRSSPVSVVGGFTNWRQVSAGGYHTVALRANGTLWAWGLGRYGDSADSGQLGDGTTTGKSSPVSVVGGFTDWCQVSAGTYHNAAVRRNGTLWTWGANGCGRLGDGTVAAKCSPVSVIGGFTDWCQVSAGYDHNAAVRQNGTLWTWGSNGCGKLATSLIGAGRSSPVSVVGGFTDWCQVSVGEDVTTAIRTNGSLWSWGEGICGKLGDGTTVSKASPVSIAATLDDKWCFVDSGAASSVAILMTKGF